jgi:hypothetical protein
MEPSVPRAVVVRGVEPAPRRVETASAEGWLASVPPRYVWTGVALVSLLLAGLGVGLMFMVRGAPMTEETSAAAGPVDCGVLALHAVRVWSPVLGVRADWSPSRPATRTKGDQMARELFSNTRASCEVGMERELVACIRAAKTPDALLECDTDAAMRAALRGDSQF